jgi:hypothetical protein
MLANAIDSNAAHCLFEVLEKNKNLKTLNLNGIQSFIENSENFIQNDGCELISHFKELNLIDLNLKSDHSHF